MSGHNKWAKIKRKKAVTDQSRGRFFSQVIKEITVAAKTGGGNPEGNSRLRIAIEKARAGNMPADNIKRAIMKGTGELPGASYEDASYEAYGPGGVAIIIDTVTDNKNRTVSEIRHVLERNHGKLATTGSVAFQFHKKGIIAVPRSAVAEDDLLTLALDAGADDVRTDENDFTVVMPPETFEQVRKALEDRKVHMDSAEIMLVADNTVHVEGKDAENLLKLMEFLEEHDDVQKVHSNFEIDDKELAQLSASPS